MTTTEAAAVLGVKPRRVRLLITEGTLRARRVGRTYDIHPQSVEAELRRRAKRWIAKSASARAAKELRR